MARTITIGKSAIGSMTVADLEVLEDRTGRPLSRLFDADAPRGALLHALAFVVLRREDPDVTWEQSGDVVVELEDDDDAGEVGTTTPGPTRAGRRKRGA